MENLFSGCYICNNYYLSLTDKVLYLVARARGQEDVSKCKINNFLNRIPLCKKGPC